MLMGCAVATHERIPDCHLGAGDFVALECRVCDAPEVAGPCGLLSPQPAVQPAAVFMRPDGDLCCPGTLRGGIYVYEASGEWTVAVALAIDVLAVRCFWPLVLDIKGILVPAGQRFGVSTPPIHRHPSRPSAG